MARSSTCWQDISPFGPFLSVSEPRQRCVGISAVAKVSHALLLDVPCFMCKRIRFRQALSSCSTQRPGTTNPPPTAAHCAKSCPSADPSRTSVPPTISQSAEIKASAKMQRNLSYSYLKYLTMPTCCSRRGVCRPGSPVPTRRVDCVPREEIACQFVISSSDICKCHHHKYVNIQAVEFLKHFRETPDPQHTCSDSRQSRHGFIVSHPLLDKALLNQKVMHDLVHT
jgi:hypothetical protein